MVNAHSSQQYVTIFGTLTQPDPGSGRNPWFKATVPAVDIDWEKHAGEGHENDEDTWAGICPVTTNQSQRTKIIVRSPKDDLSLVPGRMTLECWPADIVRFLREDGVTALWSEATISDSETPLTLYVDPQKVGPFRVALLGPSDDKSNRPTDYLFGKAVLVELTNIKFNHDTGSSASDAINIRQDYSNPYDISNGEWVTGGANLPVCYTANKSITIKARFTVQPTSITSADIWAISTDSDGSLGGVVKANVTFSGGVSSPEYVTFQVSGKTPNCVKKTTTDMWQWKMENVNGSGSAACDLNASGSHTVYTIFNEPTSPWVNTAGSKRNAWESALEFAIVTCNAKNIATEDDAMAAITTHLYTILYTGASQHLTVGGNFSYTGYMTMTSANCLDSAVGLDTTGSLLGMNMVARRRTEFFNYNFHCFVKKGAYVYDSCSAMSMCIIKIDYATYIASGSPGLGSTESDKTYPIE